MEMEKNYEIHHALSETLAKKSNNNDNDEI